MHWPGIGPGSPTWQARILPLNHQCPATFVGTGTRVADGPSGAEAIFVWANPKESMSRVWIPSCARKLCLSIWLNKYEGVTRGLQRLQIQKMTSCMSFHCLLVDSQIHSAFLTFQCSSAVSRVSKNTDRTHKSSPPRKSLVKGERFM